MDSHLDADELLALAKLDIESRNFEAALKKLKLVVGADDTPEEAYLVMARLYATLGLFVKSQQLYESYNEAKPQNTIGRFEFGMTLFDSNNMSGALEYWDTILNENRTHPPSLFYSALAHRQLGQISKARDCLDILMKSVTPENMYFQKGKDLGLSIDLQQKEADSVSKPVAIETYNGEEVTH